MKIDTLLLDLDGTLVDSNELILKTLRLTIEQYFPFISLTPEALLEMMGPPLSVTFGKLTSDPERIREMITTYRRLYTDTEFHYIRIYPGVTETLQYFHEKHFHIGLITTKFRESALPSLRHFDLDRWMDCIISLEDVKFPKPEPEPILKAMTLLQSRNAIMVGDTPADILAGKNAGILTCGVGWSYKLPELKAARPDHWIERFRDLRTVLEQYDKEE
ncbi:MAG TPA: HAD-IA family hydrolase [Candidatus Izemoplasmatales bacterium]|nr:HAD-IA family hydrolase [Bacillota bacterium]HRY77243.1 HAD-IA family hydrolase [Candidatus Izemoplasmatales bacterium]